MEEGEGRDEGGELQESGRSEKDPFPLNQLIQDYDVNDDDDDGGNWKRKKGGGIGGWQEDKQGSIFPVLLDVQVPLPGQVVVLVVVGELGFEVVGAAGQHAFGCLL